MSKIEEFTVRFHSINDATIKDKRKHFNEFLLSIQTTIDNERDLYVLVKSFTPKTPFEETFKYDIIIRLQRKDILLEELKTCNRILLKKLLKDWRLFSNTFSSMTADELINDMFLQISFTQKLKILNGISKNIKNEQLLDEYFTALEKKYGLKVATIVLPGCSIALIKFTVEKYHLKLTNAHLKRIYKKDKNFVRLYFNVIKRKYEDVDLSFDYLHTLKYIARTDPVLYWELSDCFNLNIKFGKHMTPNMIKLNEKVTAKGKSAFDLFHYLKMYKTLKKEGKLNALLLNVYPTKHDDFLNTFDECKFREFLKKIPSSSQYDILSRVFNEKYQRNLLEYPNYFTVDLLKMTPIKEREEILNVKIREDGNLLYLYSTAVSIPKFKNRLRHSSDSKTRSDIASHLFETCAVNEDADALLEILKYILKRYRNDINILDNFMQNITCWSKKQKFTDEHWEYLWNIFKILSTSRKCSFNSSVFDKGYVYYLIKNNKPCHSFIEYLVKLKADRRTYGFYDISGKRYAQTYYDELAKCIEAYKDTDKYEDLVIEFLKECSYNYLRDNVSILKYQHLFKYLTKDIWCTSITIQNIIKTDNAEVHEMFWKKQDVLYCTSPFLWYAKHRPDILIENIDKMLNRSDEFKIKNFIGKLKNFLNTDTVNKIKVIALKSIENNKCDREAKNAIRAISILAPETFLEIVPPFIPKDGKIDLGEATEKVTLLQTIVQSFSNIQDVLKSFPIISKFCIGDYLKFSLAALYSATYHTPEKYIQNFLGTFSNTAVSVRKHVLTLGRHLLTATDFHLLLNEWTLKEKNLSMRNILFRKIVEYFIENPSENFWILIKNNINRVDVDDRHLYDFLIKCQKIPLDYLPQYIELIYKEISKSSDTEIKRKKYQLINNVSNSTIDSLNQVFVNDIIKDMICTETDTRFYWRCVFFTSGEKQVTYFNENFKIFENFLYKSSSDLTQKVELRSKITNFLLHFFNLAMELKQNNSLIDRFMTSWRTLFKPEQFSREYMLIQFANLYFLSEFNTYEMGLKVNYLLHEYTTKYNNSIVHSFCQQLNAFLMKADIIDDDLFQFVNGLFKNNKDVNICVAVLYFLPKILPKADNAYADYVPILKTIEECEVPLVRYYFDSYLTSNGLESSFSN